MKKLFVAVLLVAVLFAGAAWGGEYSWICDHEYLAQRLVKDRLYPASQVNNAGGVVNGVRSGEDGLYINLSVSVPQEYFGLWRYEYDVWLHGGYYPFSRELNAKSYEDWEWLGKGWFAMGMTINAIHDGAEWLGNTFDTKGMYANFEVFLSWGTCCKM